MGFNSAFKGLTLFDHKLHLCVSCDAQN